MKSSMPIVEQMTLRHFEYLPKLAGCDVWVHGGLHFIRGGLGSSMFNIVFGGENDDRDLPLKDHVYDVQTSFQGLPFAWWVPPSKQSDSLSKTLLQSGFQVEAAEQMMVCRLDNESSYEMGGSMQIEQVCDAAQLQAFLSVLSVYDQTAGDFFSKLTLDQLQGHETLHVGRVEGLPVCIAQLFVGAEWSAIFGVITDESQRGRGFGTQMMRYLLRQSKARGIKHVCLSASSDAGFRIYERLGFEMIGQFDCFEWLG